MPEQVKQSNQPRATARINPKLDKHLVAYMAAAGAAGVSMLATAQPAEARIVYTPTNKYVNGPTCIDLNHDGIADFCFNFGHLEHFFFMYVPAQVPGNEVRIAGDGAAAGFFGMPVANGEKFGSKTFDSYGVVGVLMAGGYAYGSFSSRFGAWINTKDRYLGLKFVIQGKVHYGWARLSVTRDLAAYLTGYAYETTPDKPILEGHTSGPEEADDFAPDALPAPAPRTVTLGVLAMGAPGIAVWRREDEAAR